MLKPVTKIEEESFLKVQEIQKAPITITKKTDQGSLESYLVIKHKEDGGLVIDIKKEVELRVNGDLLFTVNGELGILSKKIVGIDSKEIHLNSRNCRQIREMKEELLDALLREIGKINNDNTEEIEAATRSFRTILKNEIKKELLEELKR